MEERHERRASDGERRREEEEAEPQLPDDQEGKDRREGNLEWNQ